MNQQEPLAEDRIEQLLLEALASGDPIEVTPEYWEKKRAELVLEAKEREAEERLEKLLLEGLDSGPATPMMLITGSDACPSML